MKYYLRELKQIERLGKKNMSKKKQPGFSEKIPFDKDNDFNSVVMENEMTGALPVISDDALEIYEETYREFYGMPTKQDKQ